MQTALRKMGNSTGLIVPSALLRELGASSGMPMDVRIEDGKVVATLLRHPREGWAEDAERVAAHGLTEEESDWLGFGNDQNDELTW